MHHAGVQFGQQPSAMSTNQVLHYQPNTGPAPVAHSSAPSVGGVAHLNTSVAPSTHSHVHHETGSTASLRQWRKKDDKFQVDASETQGPIARVAPHAHNPLPRNSLIGQTGSNVGGAADPASYHHTQNMYHSINPYQQYNTMPHHEHKNLSQVKYSEIVEPHQAQHLTPVIQKQMHSVVPPQAQKDKDYMMCSVVEQNPQAAQVSSLQLSHHVHGLQTGPSGHVPSGGTSGQVKNYYTHPKESHLNHLHPHHAPQHTMGQQYHPKEYTQNYKLGQYQRTSLGMNNQYQEYLGFYSNSDITQMYPYGSRPPTTTFRNYRNYSGVPPGIPANSALNSGFPANVQNYFPSGSSTGSSGSVGSVGAGVGVGISGKVTQDIYRSNPYGFRNISPRRIYPDVGHYPPRVSPNCYNTAQQMEYAQHYQNRRDYAHPQIQNSVDNREILSKYATHHLPDQTLGHHHGSVLDHVDSESSLNKASNSLKQFIEGYNPESVDESKRAEQQASAAQIAQACPQNPTHSIPVAAVVAPPESLYILDSTEISSEHVGEYIHLQVDKLPENIKGFYASNSVITSPLNLTQDSVIKESSLVSSQGSTLSNSGHTSNISVISEVKKFVEKENHSPPGPQSQGQALSNEPISSVIVFGEHNKTGNVDENRNLTPHSEMLQTLVQTSSTDSSVIKTTGPQKFPESQNLIQNDNAPEQSPKPNDFQSPPTPGSILEEIPKPLNEIEQFLDDSVSDDVSDMFVMNDGCDSKPNDKVIENMHMSKEVPQAEEKPSFDAELLLAKKPEVDAETSMEEVKVLKCESTDPSEQVLEVKGDSVTLKIAGELLKISLVKTSEEVENKGVKISIKVLTDCDVFIDKPNSQTTGEPDTVTKEDNLISDDTMTKNDSKVISKSNVDNSQIDDVPILNVSEISETQNDNSKVLELDELPQVENSDILPMAADMPDLHNQVEDPVETLIHQDSNSEMPELDAEEVYSPHSLEAMLSDNCNEIIIEDQGDISLSALDSPMSSAIPLNNDSDEPIYEEVKDQSDVEMSEDSKSDITEKENLEREVPEVHEPDEAKVVNNLSESTVEIPEVIAQETRLDVTEELIKTQETVLVEPEEVINSDEPEEMPILKEVRVQLKESDREEVRKFLSRLRRESQSSENEQAKPEKESQDSENIQANPNKRKRVQSFEDHPKKPISKDLKPNLEKRRSSSDMDETKTDNWQIRNSSKLGESAPKRFRINSESSKDSDAKRRLIQRKSISNEKEQPIRKLFEVKDQDKKAEDVSQKTKTDRRKQRLSMEESANSPSSEKVKDKIRQDKPKNAKQENKEATQRKPDKSERHSRDDCKLVNVDRDQRKHSKVEGKVDSEKPSIDAGPSPSFISEKHNFSILSKDEKTKTKIKTPSSRNRKLESLVESSVRIQKAEKDKSDIPVAEEAANFEKDSKIDQSLEKIIPSPKCSAPEEPVKCVVKTKAQLKEAPPLDNSENINLEKLISDNEDKISEISSEDTLLVDMSLGSCPEDAIVQTPSSPTKPKISGPVSIMGTDRKKLSLAEYKKKRSDQLPSLDDFKPEEHLPKPAVAGGLSNDYETHLERILDAPNHSKLNIPAIIETIPLDAIRLEEVVPVVIALENDKNVRPTDPRRKPVQEVLDSRRRSYPQNSDPPTDPRLRADLKRPSMDNSLNIYSEQIAEANSNRVLEMSAERTAEKTIEKLPERISEKIPERISEKVPGRISEKVSERISEKIPESISEKISERILEKIPQRISENIPERITEKIPDRISEKIPERGLGKIHDKASENVPQNIIDKTTNRDIPKFPVTASEKHVETSLAYLEKSTSITPPKQATPDGKPKSEESLKTTKPEETKRIPRSRSISTSDTGTDSGSGSDSGSDSSTSDSDSSGSSDTNSDSSDSSAYSRFGKLQLSKKLKKLSDRKAKAKAPQTQNLTDLNKEIDNIFSLTQKKFEIRPRRTAASSENESDPAGSSASQRKRFFINLDEIKTNLDFSENAISMKNTSALSTSPKTKKKKLIIDPDDFNLDDEYLRSSSDSDREAVTAVQNCASLGQNRIKNIIDLNELLPTREKKSPKIDQIYNPEDTFMGTEMETGTEQELDMGYSRIDNATDPFDSRNIDSFMNKEPPSESYSYLEKVVEFPKPAVISDSPAETTDSKENETEDVISEDMSTVEIAKKPREDDISIRDYSEKPIEKPEEILMNSEIDTEKEISSMCDDYDHNSQKNDLTDIPQSSLKDFEVNIESSEKLSDEDTLQQTLLEDNQITYSENTKEDKNNNQDAESGNITDTANIPEDCINISETMEDINTSHISEVEMSIDTLIQPEKVESMDIFQLSEAVEPHEKLPETHQNSDNAEKMDCSVSNDSSEDKIVSEICESKQVDNGKVEETDDVPKLVSNKSEDVQKSIENTINIDPEILPKTDIERDTKTTEEILTSSEDKESLETEKSSEEPKTLEEHVKEVTIEHVDDITKNEIVPESQEEDVTPKSLECIASKEDSENREVYENTESSKMNVYDENKKVYKLKEYFTYKEVYSTEEESRSKNMYITNFEKHSEEDADYEEEIPINLSINKVDISLNNESVLDLTTVSDTTSSNVDVNNSFISNISKESDDIPSVSEAQNITLPKEQLVKQVFSIQVDAQNDVAANIPNSEIPPMSDQDPDIQLVGSYRNDIQKHSNDKDFSDIVTPNQYKHNSVPVIMKDAWGLQETETSEMSIKNNPQKEVQNDLQDQDDDISCTIEETKMIFRNLRKGTKKALKNSEIQDCGNVDVIHKDTRSTEVNANPKRTIEDISKRLMVDILKNSPEHHGKVPQFSEKKTEPYSETPMPKDTLGYPEGSSVPLWGSGFPPCPPFPNLSNLGNLGNLAMTSSGVSNYYECFKWQQWQYCQQMYYYQQSHLLQQAQQAQNQSNQSQNPTKEYGVLSSGDLKMKLHRIQPQPSQTPDQDPNLLPHHSQAVPDEEVTLRKRRRRKREDTDGSTEEPDDYLVVKTQATTTPTGIPKLILKRSVSNSTTPNSESDAGPQISNNNYMTAVDHNSHPSQMPNRDKCDLVPIVRLERDPQLDILAYSGRRRRKS